MPLPYKILISGLCFFLLSCEKEVDIDVPQRIKPVIQAFLSPDDTVVEVHVSWSVPVIMAHDSIVNTLSPDSTARVFVIDETGNETELFFQEFNMSHTADPGEIIIESGKTYRVKVIMADGKTYEASTTVPQKRDYQVDVVLDSQITATGRVYKARITWHDDFPGAACFRANAYLAMFDDSTMTPSMITMQNTTNYGLTRGNGKSGVQTLELSGVVPDFMSHPIGLELYWLSTDEAYYKYHFATFKAVNYGNQTSDPVIMYSNVPGALGVVSSYNNEVRIEKFF